MVNTYPIHLPDGEIVSGLYGRQWVQGLLAGFVVGFPGGGSMQVE